MPTAAPTPDMLAAREQAAYAAYREAAGKVLGALLARDTAGPLCADTQACFAVLLGRLYDERDRARLHYDRAQTQLHLAVFEQASAAGTYAVVAEVYTVQPLAA